MSKKTNTLLFILGGTVFNILVTVVCFVVLLVIFGKLYPLLPENSTAWIMPVIFIVSIAVSFFAYRFALKVIMEKVDMEKYFDPIFGYHKPPRKD